MIRVSTVVKTVIMLKIFSLCIQARHQNSLSGGGGRKNIWGGGTDQFYRHLWEGRPKKRSLSWPFTFFQGTSLAREHVHCLAERGGIQ